MFFKAAAMAGSCCPVFIKAMANACHASAKSGAIVSLLTYDLRDQRKQTRVVNIRVEG